MRSKLGWRALNAVRVISHWSADPIIANGPIRFAPRIRLVQSEAAMGPDLASEKRRRRVRSRIPWCLPCARSKFACRSPRSGPACKAIQRGVGSIRRKAGRVGFFLAPHVEGYRTAAHARPVRRDFRRKWRRTIHDRGAQFSPRTSEAPVRATGTHLGHGMEPQFPMNIALAALAVGRGELFPATDSSGVEQPMEGALSQLWSRAWDIARARAWRWFSRRQRAKQAKISRPRKRITDVRFGVKSRHRTDA